MNQPHADERESRTRELAAKYSTQERFRNSSDDENWFRAESQLGYNQQATPLAIQELSESLKPLSGLLSQVLTISSLLTLLGVVTGAWIVVAYLNKVGSPVPAVDATLAISIGAVFFVLFLSLFTAFICPFLPKYMDSSLESFLPTLVYKAPWQERLDYVREYTIYYLPYLGACIFLLFHLNPHFMRLGYHLWHVMIITVVVEGLLLRRQGLKRSLSLDWIRVVSLLPYSLIASLLSMLWTLPLFLKLTNWIDSRLNGWSQEIGYCLGMVSLVTLHFVISLILSGRRETATRRLTLLLVMLFLFTVIGVGPAYLGGSALRFLRVGGGIPVSISLKTVQTNTTPALLSGCLLLMSGTQIVISPGPVRDCSISFSPIGEATAYKPLQIELHERSDVTSMTLPSVSRFPSKASH